ncbi:hypothetical protein AX16_001782 [Volvariella volvacea WC 439]|nr:hypothetical protein AX16_001782 [Volvariella volvacea WC 439]
MDRPMGPRQPPARGDVAFESIFGRPSAAHHQQPSHPPHYHPAPVQHPHLQPAPYQHPHYAPTIDRRSSHQPPRIPAGYPVQPPPSGYPQQYPPNVPGQQPQPPSGYPIQQPPAYNHPPPSNHYNPPLARARSVPHTGGAIMPPLGEPPDRGPAAFQQQPMQPPAQNYPHQVFLNSPAGPQGDWSRYQNLPGPADRNSYPPQIPPIRNGSNGRPPDPPRLGVTLEHDDGRLGLDFSNSAGDSGSGNSSDQGTDDGSSELPWMRSDDTTNSRRRSQPNPAAHSHTSKVCPSFNGSRALPNGLQTHPLRVDTASVQSARTSFASASPASSTIAEASTVTTATATAQDQHPVPGARRSSDSTRTGHRNSATLPRRDRTPQDRSMSMSAATTTLRAALEQKAAAHGRDSPSSVRPRPRKTPIVYPALLSKVAEAFRDRIPLADREKDGLTYKNAFDGREAVDRIAYIIKTTDRNLALLLGRALDAQKFFHDVTYDHRLRDSPNELYQFQTRVPSPFVSGEFQTDDPIIQNGKSANDSSAEENHSPAPAGRSRKDISTSLDDVPLPSGVFTLLTDCYSPTCSRDQLCYSIACPRRLEQQARLHMKPHPGLSQPMAQDTMGDVDKGPLWVKSVPQEIVNSVSETERKRQEAINEVIYTERDYVHDLEYLRDCWINRLNNDECIQPPKRREEFLTNVFWNVHEILQVNIKLRDALAKRQKSYAVVERIGDIFLEHVPNFAPYVKYGAHQLYGKYEFEKEKSSNPAFAAFVEVTERLPESRKLELNAYLTKPTTRLARYPLLLEAVLKHTPPDSPDKTIIPQVISIVRDFLAKVNVETGKTENRFNLTQLDQLLIFKQGEEPDLRLTEEGREIIHKGTLNKRDGEVQVHLFDHAILFTKVVRAKQQEQYKVYRRPIPLELLSISASEDFATATTRPKDRQRQTLVNPRNNSINPSLRVDAKSQYWINFSRLGRNAYSLLLYANSALSQKKWVESIEKQQQMMRERSLMFDTFPLSEGFFTGGNRVNCAAPFHYGRKVAYGTDDGVYISDLRDTRRDPIRVLALMEVTQVDVLEDYQLLIVLSERQVITFPLDALDPHDPTAGLKRAKRISSHTSFFKAGFCLGRMLVCIVKSSQLSSTFKTLEPIDQNVRGRSKPTFRKLLQGGNDTLKLFREFYIPVESTSIHYLKTKMCVGCSRGFEIVDLETLDTQGLLDPNDDSLEFVRKRENLRPMAIYRIYNEFLLCYDEFAFYVNKNGRRSRKEFMIVWEGTPTGFALHEPYVLAFDPTFVEIRNIETGSTSQVIQGSNVRLLFADSPPSYSSTSTPAYYPNLQAPYPSPYGQDPYSPQGHPPHQMGGPAYAAYPQQQYQQPPSPYAYSRNPLGPGRDEILMVSDDRVFSLRMTNGAQRYMSDNVSVASTNR